MTQEGKIGKKYKQAIHRNRAINRKKKHEKMVNTLSVQGKILFLILKE